MDEKMSHGWSVLDYLPYGSAKVLSLLDKYFLYLTNSVWQGIVL